MMERREPNDLAALRHPLFWGALALLVVNDHLLKGSELVPGWLTGKLSDFAGLIVAPIVLSVLLRARSDRRRALAFGLVGGWFAAANLLPPVAAATTALGEALGLSWTFWVDPTDLVALAVLPVAWQLHRRGRAGGKELTQRLALGLGVAACVASPPPEPFWNTGAFVVNDTGRQLELRVRWVETSIDCDAVADRYADALPRDVFGPGTLFLVEENATLPLDRGVALGTGPAWDRDPAAETPHDGSCDAVMISAVGLPDQVVFWQSQPQRTIPDVVEDDEDRAAVANGLFLIPSGDGIALRDGPGYQHTEPVEIYDGGDACRDYGDITGFDWSELPSGWMDGSGRARLLDVRPTVDDCVFLEVEDLDDFGGTGAVHEIFLCIPPDDFPFLPNSEVQVNVTDRALRMWRDLETDAGTWRTGEIVVMRGAPAMNEGPFAVDLTMVDAACAGMRMECGGFRLPMAAALTMGSTTRFVHPGEMVEREAADGRRARLRVGRAETMWVTDAGCGAGRDVLGPRLEALVVYGEEPR